MTVDGSAVLLEIGLTVKDFGAEQVIDPIAGRITKRVIQVTADLQEATLTNMQLAQNQLLTISQGAGYAVADPVTASSAGQPQYMALIIDGWAPTTDTAETQCRRRTVVRKCLSTSKVDLQYEKEKQVVYHTTWTGYYVSAGVAPYEITDQQQ
jgi:hypothetical protein